MMKKLIALLLFTLFLISILSGCVFSAGTLGGFESHVFNTSKRKVERSIDSLYSKNPQYLIPENWKEFDSWSQRGYDFLDSRMFYFDSGPQEMYYVSFIGDSNEKEPQDREQTELAIRAVFHQSEGWRYEREMSLSERKRIVNRFTTEIIIPLENYIKEQ